MVQSLTKRSFKWVWHNQVSWSSSENSDMFAQPSLLGSMKAKNNFFCKPDCKLLYLTHSEFVFMYSLEAKKGIFFENLKNIKFLLTYG